MIGPQLGRVEIPVRVAVTVVIRRGRNLREEFRQPSLNLAPTLDLRGARVRAVAAKYERAAKLVPAIVARRSRISASSLS